MSGEDGSRDDAPIQGRSEILDRLKATLADPDARFKVPELQVARTKGPSPVTHVGEQTDLSALFGAMLDAVGGSHEIVDEPDAVPNAVIRHFETLRNARTEDGLSFDRVLAWAPEMLGVTGLEDTLLQVGIEILVPSDLHEVDCREEASSIAVGITGADAAMASTGTLVLGTGPGRSRAASLLPLHHIALVAASRIHTTIEAWMAALREEGRLDEALRTASQVTLVTGPSKSADIELTLTLGVHGPRTVHAIVYGDGVSGRAEPAPDSRVRNVT